MTTVGQHNGEKGFISDPKRKSLLLMLTRVRAALSVGGPLQNAGRMAQTVSIYQRTVRSMLSVDQRQFLLPDVIETLEAAQNFVSHCSDMTENAWKLRKALDQIYDKYIDMYCGLDGMGFLPIHKKISQTIDLGAPMYNAGRIEECMRLYLKLAKGLQTEKELSVKAQAILTKSVNAYAESPDEYSSNAWALRKALDYIYDEVRLPEVYTAPKTIEQTEGVVTEEFLLDFTGNDKGLKSNIVIFNDSIMGGSSVSEFKQGDGKEAFAKFEGNVAVSNQGGFSSVRLVPNNTANFRETLKGCVGILISVKSLSLHNVRYKLQLASETKMKAFNWQTDFIVRETDTFKHIYLHLSSFWPTLFGHVLSNRGNVDLEKVDSIGFILSRLSEDGKENPDFQQGDFGLAIEWVKILKKASPGQGEKIC